MGNKSETFPMNGDVYSISEPLTIEDLPTPLIYWGARMVQALEPPFYRIVLEKLGLGYFYNDFWQDYSLERSHVKHFPLANGGPWPLVNFMFIYLLIIGVLAPQFMK